MKSSMQRVALALLATASIWWLSGCSGKTDTPKDDKKGEHKGGEHKKDGDHHDEPLTEKDVKMPKTFKDGVTRLEELHRKIHHEIEEEGGLKHVHRIAEEMAVVATGMKNLAAKDLPEEKLTEAGRLCNEVAGYYKPIDEAADAGKKAETEAIHKKMGEAIGKLKALTK